MLADAVCCMKLPAPSYCTGPDNCHHGDSPLKSLMLMGPAEGRAVVGPTVVDVGEFTIVVDHLIGNVRILSTTAIAIAVTQTTRYVCRYRICLLLDLVASMIALPPKAIAPAVNQNIKGVSTAHIRVATYRL